MSFVSSSSRTLVSRVSVLSFLSASSLFPSLLSHPRPQTPGFSRPSVENPSGISSCLFGRVFPGSACPRPLLPIALLCIIAECTPFSLLPPLLPSVALKCVYRRAREKIHFCAAWLSVAGAVGSSGPLVWSIRPSQGRSGAGSVLGFLACVSRLVPSSPSPPLCLGSVCVRVGDVGRAVGRGSSGLTDGAHRAGCPKASGLFLLGFEQYCPALLPGLSGVGAQSPWV